MSIESYILGLQKNPSPGKIGKVVLGVVVNHGFGQDFITRMASHIF